MKLATTNSFNYTSSLVKLKGESWLKNLRIAGNAHKKVMAILAGFVRDKVNMSLLEMDEIAGREISSHGCLPTFKDYKGFPANCCMSINNELVHGIPSNRKLKEGDLITFDFGCTYSENGMPAIADAARTFVFGEGSEATQKMIDAGKACFDAGVAAMSIGKRVGVIGEAIHKTAKSLGFNVIENFGGHGVCHTNDGIGTPHTFPFIANKATRNDGIRIQKGLAICIEPLLVPASCPTDTLVSSDKWTVMTKDIGVHYEDTIYVHEDHMENTTRE
jgi:methionyl aminopeptidase